jgi:DNA-binding GntR family transcriptional regulator
MLNRSISTRLIPAARGQQAVDEHRAIFDAALARDADAAGSLLETHITNGLTHTLDALAD